LSDEEGEEDVPVEMSAVEIIFPLEADIRLAFELIDQVRQI